MSTAQVLQSTNTYTPKSSTGTTTEPTTTRPHKKGQPTIASLTTSSKNASQNAQPQPKKIPRKSSKPILTWFQRKLGGTVKQKQVSIADLAVGRSPHHIPRFTGRAASSPLPHAAQSAARQSLNRESTLATRRTTFSDDEDTREFYPRSFDDNTSIDRSSFARDSLWSPASALEADDDASVRPIPPSAPPSPSPSRSSSSYLSDPRTFRSIAASTKPTTVLSIDLGGNGMAHIAQVPPNATPNPVHRIAPHIRHSSSLSSPSYLGSANSITFSALPSSMPQSSNPPSVRNPGSVGSMNFTQAISYSANMTSSSHVQAPLHTAHHPRNNPRPSSPPLDNASMLTLASSAYALPGRGGLQAYSIAPSPVGDNGSHYGGSMIFPDGESTSQFLLGDDDRLDERDIDASVRALRPRSSRRGSWESEASRWSARVQLGTGTSSLVRERSLWTTNSIRTGGFSPENGDVVDRADDDDDFEGEKLNEPDISLSPPSPLETHDPECVVVTDDRAVDSGKLRESVDESEEAQLQLRRPSTETIAQASPAMTSLSDGHEVTAQEDQPKVEIPKHDEEKPEVLT